MERKKRLIHKTETRRKSKNKHSIEMLHKYLREVSLCQPYLVAHVNCKDRQY